MAERAFSRTENQKSIAELRARAAELIPPPCIGYFSSNSVVWVTRCGVLRSELRLAEYFLSTKMQQRLVVASWK